MPKEVKTWDPAINGYRISYIEDDPKPKGRNARNSCCSGNMKKVAQGQDMGDGDPAWIKRKCSVCGHSEIEG